MPQLSRNQVAILSFGLGVAFTLALEFILDHVLSTNIASQDTHEEGEDGNGDVADGQGSSLENKRSPTSHAIPSDSMAHKSMEELMDGLSDDISLLEPSVEEIRASLATKKPEDQTLNREHLIETTTEQPPSDTKTKSTLHSSAPCTCQRRALISSRIHSES
ncbi:hypothetical protein OCU04_011915 [Sclerotinia nivalis]|uniref:Uncharacterized protein n=1 Tax=Sclerotinia nivalis TaxID=352851 RepID=A0A9X0A9V1_9HELO|nr:hypothetical protein OCU04_011915 [Sclerotinia nivalis]